MLIDTEKMVHASSVSADKGRVDMELEGVFAEMRDVPHGEAVRFAVVFCDSLVIVFGILREYREVEADLKLSEQGVVAKLSVYGRSVTISL